MTGFGAKNGPARHLAIESDGTVPGTRVFINGLPIENVEWITFTMDAATGVAVTELRLTGPTILRLNTPVVTP